MRGQGGYGVELDPYGEAQGGKARTNLPNLARGFRRVYKDVQKFVNIEEIKQ